MTLEAGGFDRLILTERLELGGTAALDTQNTFENPQAVVMRSVAAAKPLSGDDEWVLPPYSFTVLRLKETQ